MPYMTYPLAREDPQLIDVICDDIVEMTLQYSTQWDSLAHVGQLFDADGDGTPEIVFYNGYRGGEHIIGPMDYRGGGAVERGAHVGATALGIENMAAHGVQGRGVMIDLEAHFGRGEKFVSYDELMHIMEADKVDVEEGDLVCFRTGYDRVILGMNKNPDAATLAANPCAALDGRDERILNWITKTGIVALISDNRAVEASPSRPCEGEDQCASLPLHAHCLFKLGVYLGEIWLLSDLADWLRAHKVTDVDVCGIATDYCMRATALDAVTQEFSTRVLTRLCAGVAADSSRLALVELADAGVDIAFRQHWHLEGQPIVGSVGKGTACIETATGGAPDVAARAILPG